MVKDRVSGSRRRGGWLDLGPRSSGCHGSVSHCSRCLHDAF